MNRLLKLLHRFNNLLKKIISLAKFKLFEKKINKKSIHLHDSILGEAREKHHSNNIAIREDVRIMRENLLSLFKDKFKDKSNIRLLIHLPSFEKSPGGFSLFYNLYESIKFLGVEVETLNFGEPIALSLHNFKPNFFISSDNEIFKKQIDWKSIAKYRKENTLKIGLTASLEEYGNTPLSERLLWAKNNKIDFFYSFRTPEYLQTRLEYKPYFDNGYKIFSIEFGANILIYYPVNGIFKDLDYVFLASSNPDKRERYYSWLSNIFKKSFGFINGPGWTHSRSFASREIHSLLYARAKVGINLHINDSIDQASELNERTYILAACGVPQLVDQAKLLNERFSSNCYFEGKNPLEYDELFDFILNNPEEANYRAMNALKEVYSKHTTLHRADGFIKNLLTI